MHVQTVRSNLFGTQAKRHPWVNALRVLTSPRLLFYLWIERKRLHQSASHVVFASDALKMDTLAAWPELDTRKLSVIRPGTYVVDLPRSPQDLRARKVEAQIQVKTQHPQLQDLPSQTIWLLFAANDWSKKGLKTALQALAELPAHCHLLIAGKTEQWPTFARQLQQPQIIGRTHILGPVDGLSALYQACDLLLHPTHQDAYPMVVLEAFGHGLPVITTTTPFNGLAAELNDHQQALLIKDPHQAQALVHAIRQSLNDLEQTANRVHAAHAFARAYAWDSVAQCYASCYEDALQIQREASQHASR